MNTRTHFTKLSIYDIETGVLLFSETVDYVGNWAEMKKGRPAGAPVGSSPPNAVGSPSPTSMPSPAPASNSLQSPMGGAAAVPSLASPATPPLASPPSSNGVGLRSIAPRGGFGFNRFNRDF